MCAGLPSRLSSKESACQCRRRGFSPWAGKITRRRKWQPTPVFLPGKNHGWRSLAGSSPWGHRESETAERECTEESVYVSPSLPFIPSLRQPLVCSLHWYLYFCFVNKFICTISFDSTYKQYQVISVFLCLIYFTQCYNL